MIKYCHCISLLLKFNCPYFIYRFTAISVIITTGFRFVFVFVWGNLQVYLIKMVFKKPKYETNDEKQIMVSHPTRYVHFSAIREHNIGIGRQQIKWNKNWRAETDPSWYTQFRTKWVNISKWYLDYRLTLWKTTVRCIRKISFKKHQKVKSLRKM